MTVVHADLLDDLNAVLQWGPTAVDIHVWRECYDVHLKSRFLALASSDEDVPLRDALRLLPTGVQKRFLRAPAVSSLLLRSRQDAWVDVSLIADFLVAEFSMLGLPSRPQTQPIWTARGCHVEGEGAQERLLPDTTISLDYDSPFPFPDGEFGVDGFTEVGPQDRPFIERALHAAIKVLGSVSQGTPRFVDAFTEVAAIRRETAGAAVLHSSSFSGLIGLTRLTIARLEAVTPVLLAEGLLHEAMHAMLYTYEEVVEPFVLDPAENDRRVESPWTGNAIRLQSLVHACAVWYGLYWFLRRTLEVGIVADETTVQRVELARRGFERGAVSASLAAHSEALSPRILAVLGRLEDRIRPLAALDG